MRFPTALGALIILLLALLKVSTAQQCEETATGQIQNVLDKVTNRILLGEVIEGYGEEGQRILFQIASDAAQPPERRGKAIWQLAEHRSPAGEDLLKGMLNDPKTICEATSALQLYRDPELIPKFINLLDDHSSCGNEVRVDISGDRPEEKTEVYLSDEAVDALESISGNRLEKERDLFIVGHRSTQVWKAWWDENAAAFKVDPTHFLKPESSESSANASYPCSVETIAVSPDGKAAFSAGKDYDPWVRAWSIESRQQLWATPNVKDDDVQSSAYSPDGRIIAMGTLSGASKVIDAATGNRLRTLIGTSGVEEIAFNHNGAILASAQDDGVIRLFDTKTWCEIKHFDNPDMITGIAFSPDGALLAAATFEQVRLWNVTSGTVTRTFKVRPGAPPRTFADAGERDAQLWRMAWKVAFSPDGKVLATGSSGAIQLWSPTSGQQIASTSSGGQVGSLHFSQDGRWVIWGNDRDRIVRWNPESGQRQRIKNEFSSGVTAITPDGKLVLSPGAGQEIGIFDLAARHKVGVLQCVKKN